MRARYVSLLCASVAMAWFVNQDDGLAMREGVVRSSSRQPATSASLSEARRGAIRVRNYYGSTGRGPEVVGQDGGSSPSARNGLPLVIDGAKTPELISDAMAYRHFISVSAVSTAAPAEILARRDAFLARLALTPEDREAYIDAIRTVKDELTAIELERQRQGHEGAVALRQQQGHVLDDAAERVRASLSPSGAKTLQVFIQTRVKTRIRVFAQP